MRKHRRSMAALVMLAASSLFCMGGSAGEKDEAGGAPAVLKILCTTFPMFQIARNVVGDVDGVAVDILLPASAGCPHDYALTPRDLAKLAGADVLVANGLGMENFLGSALIRANPDIMVIDSAEGMDDLLGYESIGVPVKVYMDGYGHAHDENCDHDYEEIQGAAADREHAGEQSHGHGRHVHNDEINPHLFVSPVLNAELAENIARQLGQVDEDRSDLYRRNADAYAAAMRRLADDMKKTAAGFANNRIVEPHGAFDYLARDIGLEVAAIMQPNGQELSAAQMLELIEDIRENAAGVIVTEPQYPARTGEMLARETGLPVVMLDPGASGPNNAPLNHFETVMRRNIETLAKTLGRK